MLLDRLDTRARASFAHRRTPRPWFSGLLLVSVLGCAPPPAPLPPVKDPHSDARLKTATDAHEALHQQLTAVPPDDLAYCRTNSGDCLISVSERRDDLIRSDYVTGCLDPDPEKQSPCLAQSLQQKGKLDDLAALYEAENWCSRTLLECTADLEKDAARAATRERARKRRRAIENAPKSVEATSLPELAHDQMTFVRSTLPPAAQTICPQTTPEKCAASLKAPTAELETELAKDDGAYSEEHALADYAAIEHAKADCYRGESACLSGVFPQYGGNAESSKLLDQSLGLLEKQAHAKLHADADAAGQCMSDGVIQNQNRIVSAYQDYVANSSSPALVKLLKTFIQLHQAQLWCLEHLKK